MSKYKLVSWSDGFYSVRKVTEKFLFIPVGFKYLNFHWGDWERKWEGGIWERNCRTDDFGLAFDKYIKFANMEKYKGNGKAFKIEDVN